MKIKIKSLTLALVCAALLPAALSAGAPLKINFQGRLDEGGQPAAGAKTFVFEIYDAASGGSPLWTSAPQALDLAGGVFSAVLSAGSPADLSTATFSGPRYVAMTVDGVPLSPRQEMVSAPYAMVAQALAPDAVLPPAQLLAASVTDYHVLLSTAAIGSGKFGDARVSLSTAAVASGRFGDDRVLITTGAFTGGFNGGDQLVQLDGAGKLPASALTETDPLFVVSASSLVVSGDIANWDAAYAWGDHAAAGYETAAAHSASLTAYAALAATQTFSGVNTFSGGVSMPIRSVSASGPVTDSDHTLLANSAGGDITLSLPSAVGRAGRIYAVKKTAVANNVLIAPQIGQTIDSVYNSNPGFENPLRLNSVDGWDSVMLQSDGGNWFILSSYSPPPPL
ncbi:MAG: hypothetical protein CVU79_04345 [Elusimicrobia bacterium HGW-Elusimicrobia-3]|nr:MAG: hypothetical protein CVU79_04345 [Elusimicrobia bacterium HGW-Elusimicrobia-3]